MQTPRRWSTTTTTTLMAMITAFGAVIVAPASGAPDAPAPAVVSLPAAQAASVDRAPAAHWVVDPAAIEDDVPSRGRSLFDFVVTQEDAGGQVQAVPFPFSALLQRIASRTAGAGRNGRSAAPTAVLIPLGRSLQRTAAAPRFFAFPRAVVAATGDPVAAGDPYAKDRLYLGYQEKAGVIEVISYNEAEGRFEFQVVSDYRPGGTPKIAYANRTLCIACHQNAAPIFSRAVWDETNANPAVAQRLAAEHRPFYGIAVDRGIDVPNAIDDAKLRANRFAVHQLLWKEGCGDDRGVAIACRAGLFAAMLRYRLSGQASLAAADSQYRDEVVRPLLTVARARWPGGLAIGNPDIPNRNPLAAGAPMLWAAASSDGPELADVPAAFDPLVPRPPLETWRVDDDGDVARLVAGLSDFLAEPDVELVDRTLLARAAAMRGEGRTYRAPCSIERAPVDGGRQRIEFRCKAANRDGERGVVLEGRVLVAGNQVAGGAIDRLVPDGLPPSRDLDLEVRRSDVRGAGSKSASFLAATPMRARLRARGADGNAFERVELRWNDRDGAATVVALDDFAAARSAIDELARADVAGTFDGFDALAFRRARVMPALLSRLGAKSSAWCCIDAAGMPAPLVSRAGTRGLPAGESFESPTAASHAAFHRYCAECHGGSDRAPPNFLLGTADEVEAKIRHCAPRIYYRLSMWHGARDARTKTPMPPELALRHLNLAETEWREGGALSGLLLSIDERLKREGSAGTGEALLRQPYERLRACLPDATHDR